MIVAQVEDFTAGIPELEPILPLHHAELAIDPLEIPLEPKWDLYRARDAAGQVLYVTVRENGELIGYFVGFIVESLHNPLQVLVQDVFYTRQEKRLHNAGTLLFEAVEREFKRRGGGRWIVACKTHVPADGFFRGRGFSHIENSYWKMV